MNFDVFFSEKDRLEAVNTAKQMVFLPDNCYFIENQPLNINFYQNENHEIFAQVIVAFQNHVTELITEQTLILKFQDRGLRSAWEYVDSQTKKTWLV